jgi:hypothetical protein
MPGAKYMWGLGGGILGEVAVLLALVLVGGPMGFRGDNLVTAALFPHGAVAVRLLTWLNGHYAFLFPEAIRSMAAALELLQFPVYGLILAHAARRGQLPLCLLVLAGIHVVSAAVALGLGGYPYHSVC